jgi:DNA modification methylase/RES domain-containing protein
VAIHGGIELTWPGKAAPCAPLPVTMTDLVAIDAVGDGDEPNLLVHGDNLVAMSALSERYRGSIDLVYIDPPFATGLSYYSQTEVGDEQIERRAYRDRAGGMVEYLDTMAPRLAMLHSLLSDEGKLFLHCDWRANSMLRLLLDEIFGAECFRNEIVWRRAPNLGRQAASRQLGRVIDTIYVYSKTPGAPFRGTRPMKSTKVALDRQGKPRGARWDEKQQAYFTTAPRGDYTDKSIAELREQNRVYDSATGTIYIKYFLRKGEDGDWVKDQPVDALWDDYEVRPLRHRPKGEEMGYDTQKPEGLLERIVSWATRPGDRVADFYCGSGTTLAVAEAMGRRWIGCDVGGPAIDIVRRRLLDRRRALPSPQPFEILSTHRFERQRWCKSGDPARVLEAFGAKPQGGRWGEKEGSLVYAADDGSANEVAAACREARARGASRLTMLAWEWPMDGRAATAIASDAGIALARRAIPIELARDARANELAFLPPAEIEVAVTRDDGQLSLALRGARCPERTIRGGALGEVHWSELLDCWMIDWQFAGSFRARWRSYRRSRPTGDEPPLELESPRVSLASCGDRVLVRAVTIFGDTVDHAISLGAR